jgi:DASS family divalent anion:Na+ symporter
VVGNQLVAANLGWPVVFGLLNVVYYVLHYMFASQVGAACSHCGCLLACSLCGCL